MNPLPTNKLTGNSQKSLPKEGWRSWTPWSALWRYSTAQLVMYGTLASMLMPLVAQAILFATAISGGQNSSGVEKLLLTEPWRIFAVELYVSGLLLVTGKLFTQLACPERIRRFLFEDDHFVFIGEIKAAKMQLVADSTHSQDDSPNAIYSERVARLLESEESSARQTNSAWRETDLSMPILRCVIAVLFGAGSAGIVVFLGWRAFKNIYLVVGMA